jgi:xanthine/CO dehydrogenase XdhC/CoxF family maturation factor
VRVNLQYLRASPATASKLSMVDPHSASTSDGTVEAGVGEVSNKERATASETFTASKLLVHKYVLNPQDDFASLTARRVRDEAIQNSSTLVLRDQANGFWLIQVRSASSDKTEDAHSGDVDLSNSFDPCGNIQHSLQFCINTHTSLQIHINRTSKMTSVFKPGNIALITGGAGGIGLAVAKLCRSHDMKVAIVDRSSSSIESAFPKNDNIIVFTSDVASIEAWKSIKEQVLEKWGRVDLLHLNAGTTAKGGWEDVEYFHKVG